MIKLIECRINIYIYIYIWSYWFCLVPFYWSYVVSTCWNQLGQRGEYGLSHRHVTVVTWCGDPSSRCRLLHHFGVTWHPQAKTNQKKDIHHHIIKYIKILYINLDLRQTLRTHRNPMHQMFTFLKRTHRTHPVTLNRSIPSKRLNLNEALSGTRWKL